KQILQEEAQLQEIVRLVGVDSLEFQDRLTLECARSIREDFLHQIAFHEIDTYTSLNKQYGMLKAILTWYHLAKKGLQENLSFYKLTEMEVLERIGRMKYLKEEHFDEEYQQIMKALDQEYQDLQRGDEFDA
ncbi:MAG TPA: V-type ATP synthase subunit A, partial [Bacilli bacterium]|nr:V-type ATP synthase subunit A [Bacilli bacterium]